ncbi:MAG: type VI secretion system tip protein VgrG [Pseudomonadales bacterium]|nr:type VI secretion system tip protein VgrG [Pseudomonadales bacterium]
MDLTQANRFMRLKTPLKADELVVMSFYYQEAFSELFQLNLTVLSKDDNLQPNKLVGLSVTLTLILDSGEERSFNGVVISLTGGSESVRTLRKYQLVVAPWLWFLTQRFDCRIFQDLNALDIIEKVFSDLGFQDYKIGVMGLNHPVREYCVQYRESDFAFVSRLMEEEGIFYFFEQEDDKHTLVLSDDISAYSECTEKNIPVNPGSSTKDAAINRWEHQHHYGSGKWSYTDYNFKMPANSLAATTPSIIELPAIEKYEVYDYPGRYGTAGDGETLTKIRMEAIEAKHETVVADSECKTLYTSGLFTVAHDFAAEDKKSYVITQIRHRAEDLSLSEKGDGFHYQNTFSCIPDKICYRPELKTPRPTIQGTQTAIVVGPSGEEIHIDEFGRIKVQFHWDRLGKNNENSSCWIRVAQSWAGKKWGHIFTPRIGQEVVISFLEGNPDRPLIIGSVYNNDQMPPYKLPDDKSQSGLKSRSMKGGDNSTFNEIRFEDQKGSEELYIQAEKDQNTLVKNDRSQQIGHDKSEDVGNDKTESVGNNKSVTIGNDLSENITKNISISIGESHNESIGKNMSLSVGENSMESVGKNKTIDITDNQSLNVGGDLSETISKQQTVSIAQDLNEEIGGKHLEAVTKEYALSAKSMQLVADDEIVIKTGDASITMKKNGDITIKGKKITVKGSSDVVIKGSKVSEN